MAPSFIELLRGPTTAFGEKKARGDVGIKAETNEQVTIRFK